MQESREEFISGIERGSGPFGALGINASLCGKFETALATDIFSASLFAGLTYIFDLVHTTTGGRSCSLIIPIICASVTIIGEQASALTGLAPVALDSGTLPGKRAIAGGRRALRHGMFRAALVAAYQNPSSRSFADRLRRAGKPHNVIITAVARKPVTIAKPLCNSRQK